MFFFMFLKIKGEEAYKKTEKYKNEDKDRGKERKRQNR